MSFHNVLKSWAHWFTKPFKFSSCPVYATWIPTHTSNSLVCHSRSLILKIFVSVEFSFHPAAFCASNGPWVWLTNIIHTLESSTIMSKHDFHSKERLNKVFLFLESSKAMEELMLLYLGSSWLLLCFLNLLLFSFFFSTRPLKANIIPITQESFETFEIAAMV